MNILLLHGPNLSQLGARQPEHYGNVTLDGLVELVAGAAATHGAHVEHLQTEHEGELVTRLHAVRRDGTDAVLLNAGALTHYSYALRDALEMLDVVKIELHLSNIHARESFRHRSVLAAACDGSIAGLGPHGYVAAVEAAVRLVAQRTG